MGTPTSAGSPVDREHPEMAKFPEGAGWTRINEPQVDAARTRDEQASAQEGRADKGEGLESREPSKASMKHRLGDERANGERNVEANDLSRWRRSRRKKELKRS